jgi:hypothetical protein
MQHHLTIAPSMKIIGQALNPAHAMQPAPQQEIYHETVIPSVFAPSSTSSHRALPSR